MAGKVTPLAQKIARQMTAPKCDRIFDNSEVFQTFERDLHCFEVQAISKPILDAMDEQNVWPDVASILPDMFLPSPVTWIEFTKQETRLAYVLEQDGGWFNLGVGWDSAKGMGFFRVGKFRSCTILQSADQIEVELNSDFEDDRGEFKNKNALPSVDQLTNDAYRLGLQNGLLDAKGEGFDAAVKWEKAKKEMLEFGMRSLQQRVDELEMAAEVVGLANHIIAFSVLAIDLINTPGVLGMRQHQPHAGLARRMAKLGVGRFPLRAWSEVTVRTSTKIVDSEFESGPSFHKCLHFVRAHKRHYKDGGISLVKAHWRGDPALGIKRTRYKVAA